MSQHERLISLSVVGDNEVGLSLVSSPSQLQKGKRRAIGEIDVLIAGRIRAHRDGQNLSQARLAEKSGLTLTQIYMYEHARSAVPIAALVRIAQVFGVKVSSLVGEAAQTQDDSLSHLDEPDARDLLAAYASVDSSEVRRSIVALMRSLRLADQN